MTSCAHGYSNFVVACVLDGFDHVAVVCCFYNSRRLDDGDGQLQVGARCILIALSLVVIITAFDHLALETREVRKPPSAILIGNF